MKLLDENKPIFMQVAENIESDIINGVLNEGDQVPSSNQFAAFYRINPATAAKGISLLVDQGIIFKKRGIGMFVADKARATLVKKRQKVFQERFIEPLLREAESINIAREDVARMILQQKEEF